jgi:hypothetical protein
VGFGCIMYMYGGVCMWGVDVISAFIPLQLKKCNFFEITGNCNASPGEIFSK